jgi:hypothetical protein
MIDRMAAERRSERRVRRRRTAPSAGAVAAPPPLPAMRPWLLSQAVNANRHAAALRPFRRLEFGGDPAAPTEGHIQAANALIQPVRASLLRMNRPLQAAAQSAARTPTPQALGRLVQLKERSHSIVRSTEQLWDFYFELFGQRQGQYGPWLLACDRIALDCYTAAFTGINTPKSIPAPPPFCYMRTGFSPATYRRGLRLRRLGRLPNPFPLIELPYHRLVNPWTLGAVLHEVSHNLQNDLGLDRVVGRSIYSGLRQAGLPEFVARTWSRWNREAFADMSGLLLGGPAIVASLMDVIGRSRPATLGYNPSGPHPTPYLRGFLSIELLRRMGFPDQARLYRRMWERLYPRPQSGSIPMPLLQSRDRAVQVVVEQTCFQPFRTLGDRSLANAYRFEVKDAYLIEEAARRLAAGADPGVVPARYLIGAARVALDRRFARPGQIADHFYTELVRR